MTLVLVGYTGVTPRALGQVVKYIGKLDANRYQRRSENSLDTNKVHAKIVIGRNGDDGKRTALRNLNGHLHRIEVVTFDQLMRIGQRVLRHMEYVLSEPDLECSEWAVDDPTF